MPEQEQERDIPQEGYPEQEAPEVEGAVEPGPGQEGGAVPEEGGASAPAMGREDVAARLRERYPDESIGEGDDIYGVIGRYMDEDKGELDRYRESSQRLMDVINRDQLAGDMFIAMAHDENPVIFLMRRWGPDILKWISTPDGEAAMDKAAKEFAQKQEQKGRDEEQWTANVNASLERLDAFAKEHGLDDQRKEQVFDKLWQLGQKFIDGDYGDEDYSLALKALGYDDDVATAREEGEIDGRNARITERLRRSEPERAMPTSMQGGESGEEGEWEEESDEDYRRRDPFAVSGRRRIRK